MWVRCLHGTKSDRAISINNTGEYCSLCSLLTLLTLNTKIDDLLYFNSTPARPSQALVDCLTVSVFPWNVNMFVTPRSCPARSGPGQPNYVRRWQKMRREKLQGLSGCVSHHSLLMLGAGTQISQQSNSPIVHQSKSWGALWYIDNWRFNQTIV